MRQAWHLFLILLGLGSLLGSGGGTAEEAGRFWLGANLPWLQYADFGINVWGHAGNVSYTGFEAQRGSPETQGLTSAVWAEDRAHGGRAALRLTLNLEGQDFNRAKGEVFRSFDPPLNLNDPGKRVRLWLWLPAGSAGLATAPNGFQIYFKSTPLRYYARYTRWREITPGMEGVWTEIDAGPLDPPGYTDTDFDPALIVEVGLKLAVGGASALQWRGTAYVDDVSIERVGDAALAYDFEELPIDAEMRRLKNALPACALPLCRVYIFCDGRKSPDFDADGFVTGLDEYFFPDLDALLASARRFGIRLIPVLWNFDMCFAEVTSYGAAIYGKAKVVRDPARRASFVEKALLPFLERYGTATDVIHALEVMNEPELVLSGSPDLLPQAEPATEAELRAFVQAVIQAIRGHSELRVTLGSLRRSFLPFWQDLGLDYLQFHHYDRNEFLDPVVPFPWAPCADLGVRVPCFVGEVPTENTFHSIRDYLGSAVNGGYAGLLVWSMRGTDLFSNFEKVTPDLAASATLIAKPPRIVSGPGLTPQPLRQEQMGEFVVAVEDPQDAACTVQWTFGDGQSAEGPIVRHAYSLPGSYSAAVTVTNGYGKKTTADHRVEVLPPGLLVHDAVLDAEGQTGTSVVRVPITLSNPVSHTVYVDFATVSGSAKEGTDYRGQSLTLTFAPRAIRQEVEIEVLGDLDVESDENFLALLSNARGAVVDDGRGEILIRNDDRVDLKLTKTLGRCGERSIEFELAVVNLGNVPATGLVLVDDLPPGLGFLFADLPGGTVEAAGARVTGRLDSLGPGTRAVMSLAAAVEDSAGRLENRATVSCLFPDVNPQDNSATCLLDTGDWDGDGVSNADETALGWDPQNPSDLPTIREEAAFEIRQLAIRIRFTGPGSDTVRIQGSLPLAPSFDPAGRDVRLGVGGISRLFKLDATGRARSGSDRFRLAAPGHGGRAATFSACFTQVDIAQALEEAGLTAEPTPTGGKPVEMTVLLLLDQVLYRDVVRLKYVSRNGNIGAAKATPESARSPARPPDSTRPAEPRSQD